MPSNGETETGAEETTEQTDKPETGKALRTKLETTLTENQSLKGQLLIFESGLGHLNDKQRAAVVRDASEGGAELTAELLKTSATELGFNTEAPKSESQNGSEGGEGNNESGNEGGEEVIDTNADDAVDYFTAIEQAQRAASPNADTKSFEAKLRACKSNAEVDALIRTEGHRVGIVLEEDVD